MSQVQNEQPIVDERKTKELCGSERDGRRCMRPKDHEHEHTAYSATGVLTWTSPSPP